MCDWPGYLATWNGVLEQMDAEDTDFMRAQHDYMIHAKHQTENSE